MKIDRVNSADFKRASVSLSGNTLVFATDDLDAVPRSHSDAVSWIVRVQRHPEAQHVIERIREAKIDRVNLRAERVAESQISHSLDMPAFRLTARADEDGTIHVEFDTVRDRVRT